MPGLDYLATWHTSFAGHIEYAVEGLEALAISPAHAEDVNACQLGDWIKTHAGEFAHHPTFQAIIETHRDFHRQAGRVLRQHQTGLTAQQQGEDIAHLRRASANVVGAINRFLLQTQGQSGFVLAQPESCQLWDESLRLNIPVLDEQHKAIARLGQKMMAQTDMAAGSPHGQHLLSEFLRLVTLHFQTEELFMQRNAPLSTLAMAAHCDEHQTLLQCLIDLNLQQTLAGKYIPLAEYSTDLMRIVIDHVVDFDRELIHAPPV